jgi:hypothetical protein
MLVVDVARGRLSPRPGSTSAWVRRSGEFAVAASLPVLVVPVDLASALVP